jgi:hypothetical protein
VWVSDIVSAPAGGGGAASAEEAAERQASLGPLASDDAEDDACWELLPQGYRTADHVAVYEVPMLLRSTSSVASVDGADSAQQLFIAPVDMLTPLQQLPASTPSTRMVVCKVRPFCSIHPPIHPFTLAQQTASKSWLSQVSRFLDEDTQEMDSFKYAAALNEWSTFQRYAGAMKHR